VTKPHLPDGGLSRVPWLLAALALPITWTVLQQLQVSVLWRVVAASLATATPIVLGELYRGRQQASEREKRLRFLGPGGRLPFVRDISDLTRLGVTYSRIAEQAANRERPPYVPRDKDVELDEALDECQLVLVVGDSKAGKSRSAAEAMRRRFPDRRLVVPVDTAGLGALLDFRLDLRNTVVWLDQLDEYLGVEALTRLLDDVGKVGAAGPGDITVLATMRARKFESYMPARGIEPPEWKLLRPFRRIGLDRELNDAERERARELYADTGLAKALEDHGLAEYLAAGPDLLAKLDNGRILEPVGHAIVQAAAAWRRIGLERPVPRATLQALYPLYLHGARTDQPPPDPFDRGLAWARDPMHATSALLVEEPTGFVVFDYVLDHLEHQQAAVPDELWALALDAVGDAGEAIAVAAAAYRAGQPTIEGRALLQAASDPDPVAAAPAAFLLGTQLEDSDAAKANHWYRQAAESGHRDAAYSLGLALHDDDPAEAERWYRQAAEAGDVHAAYNLALLLQDDDRSPEEALHLLRRMAEAGSVASAYVLGVLWGDRDPVEAEYWYRQAAEAGDVDAAYNLALPLEPDDVEEAERFYRQAAELGDPQATGRLRALRARRSRDRPMGAMVDRLLRGDQPTTLRRCEAVVATVNAFEAEMEARSDTELRELTDILRTRLANGETLDDLLPEAFAAVRETAARTLGRRHHDVQLIGGAALHNGMIAEIKAGEGKALIATAPAYLNALTGHGVHVVTINDYLAKRHAEWMSVVYRFLGLEVGVVLDSASLPERRSAYAADVTYGTGNAFGLDYLRDNVALSVDQLVQRGHAYAIVDEVDTVLIDFADVPLSITSADWEEDVEDGEGWPHRLAVVAAQLQPDVDYRVEPWRAVSVTDEGVARAERILAVDDLYGPSSASLGQKLQNALWAKELYLRDRDYLVRDGEVLVVDERSGRTIEGRCFSAGLQQAIEAKEGVRLTRQRRTLASGITVGSYFRRYAKLAGMTDTASIEAEEFEQVFLLPVVEIPTQQETIRNDHGDVVFRTEQAKLDAVVAEVLWHHDAGRPVLVGTGSIERSERVSRLLEQHGIEHNVLNVKHQEQEARIIAQAGRIGAVTVVTGMAARGVDITLGGNVDYLADEALGAQGMDPGAMEPEALARALRLAVEQQARRVAPEHQQVVKLGGLSVLGTERHRSRRVDDRLRGLAGQCGEPGESRFYCSLEDDLMRDFRAGPGLAARLMKMFRVPDDTPISNRAITRSIATAQSQFQALRLEQRMQALQVERILDEQREIVYENRRKCLEGGPHELQAALRDSLTEVVTDLVAMHAPRGHPNAWDLDGLHASLAATYPLGLRREELDLESPGSAGLQALVISDIEGAWAAHEADLGPEVLWITRATLLAVIDRYWREHLDEMGHLRDSISARAIGRGDPLAVYRREAFELFQAMQESVRREAISSVFMASTHDGDASRSAS
jgi:preprotein translocase subunit SecA